MCKASRVKATACSGCHSCPKMAQDCPLCFSKGVFQQWSLLKDSLVSLSTRSFICPLCCGVHEGLDKFTLHLVSHEMEAKKNSNRNEDVPTISIKEGSAVDSLDELLADFSEFVKQEDKLTYDNQVKLRTKAPNPLRMSPKNKSPIGLPMSVISSTSNAHFPTIQTPLPLPQTFKPNQNLLMNHHHNDPNAIEKTIAQTATSSMMPNPPALTRSPQIQPQTAASSSKKSSSGDQPGSPPNQVQCSLCGWNFDNDEFLKVHTVLMHSKRNQAFLQRRLKRVVDEYKCRECDGTFAAYEDFVSHLKQVHNDHRFVCHICAKIFKLRGSLLVHLRVVHNPLADGAHHCKVCNRKFTNKHRRDVHEKKHTDARQFECAKCGMAFEEKGEFEIHMETHKTEHKCNICGRSFYTQAALFVHVVGHQNNESMTMDNASSPAVSSPVKVQECMVSNEAPVETKTEPLASEIEHPAFKCQVCDKLFKRESHLNQHMKVHDNKQWECDVCHKTFTTKYFLKKHKRLHTGETPYACNICGKSFTFQQSYHKHMLYHTDDKPYTCSQCGRAFKELSTLQNHERIHSGERPFACETCGKSFRQRVSYLVHRRIHTGVMPYVCSECGKSFRYKVTQRTHKCLGKSDESTPHPKPLINPLAEENASIADESGSLEQMPMIDLPQQIKDDMLSIRRSQGRKFLQGRLQGYLQKSRERAHQSEIPSPINQLEHLSLGDTLNQSQSMPNIESLLFEQPNKSGEEMSTIKTESVEDFDLQAFL